MSKVNSKKLETQLNGKDIVLFVLSKAEYSEKVLDLVRVVAKKSPALCYVSVNKPAKALIKLFDAEEINIKKFQFVDCISHTAIDGDGGRKDSGGVIILYVSSPRNLTELSITLSGAIGNKADGVFVDALTTFLIYEDGLTVVRFAHNLISNLREHESKGFFVALKNDISSSLLDDLSMFVDGVVEV